jgi:hypothetical protein
MHPPTASMPMHNQPGGKAGMHGRPCTDQQGQRGCDAGQRYRPINAGIHHADDIRILM